MFREFNSSTRDYARGGGDYAEPQYGPPVLSWFNSGLNGLERRLHRDVGAAVFDENPDDGDDGD